LQAKAQANLDKAKATAGKLRQDAVEEGKIKTGEAIARKQAELEKTQERFSVKMEEEKLVLENALLSQIPLVKESLKAKFSQL